jgi:hypothetical protein
MPGCDANIEAGAGRGVRAIAPPTNKATHQICRIKLATIYQAVGKCEGHACVVGPNSGAKMKWAAAGHFRVPGMPVASTEFQRGAERIAHCEPNQSPTRPVKYPIF